MGDKLANVLIVFMMVVILGLGGMYYVKSIGGGNNVSAGNTAQIQEQIQANVTTINTNTGTLNVNSEENRGTINQVSTEGTNIYAQNYNVSNRYYYNQLNEYSKAIYDSIINNIGKLKNGNEKIEINYDFSTVWNNGNGDAELDEYYTDAINALNLDVPYLFYIDFSKMWLNIEKVSSFFSTKYNLYISTKDNPNYYIDGYNSRQEVENAIKQVENIKEQVKKQCTGNDYSKVRKLHDWLIDYMEYDMSSNNKSSVYGAMIEKKGVCESYARTMKYILDDIGVECILVTGKATNSNGNTEDHMWNDVKIDGTWYAIDATWDDPIIVGGGKANDEIKHRYFLIGSRELYKNHEERLKISEKGKTFMLPKLSINNY